MLEEKVRIHFIDGIMCSAETLAMQLSGKSDNLSIIRREIL